MTEIEPTIDNVQPGDIVKLERGTPSEPGYSAFTVRVTRGVEPGAYTRSLDWVAGRARRGADRITRITRPAPPIPTEPGERFWARWRWGKREVAVEFMVTDEQTVVNLDSGTQWDRDMFERNHTAVPAPEPETVPVPADLIREAERWDALPIESSDVGVGILTRIVRAVQEREAGDE